MMEVIYDDDADLIRKEIVIAREDVPHLDENANEEMLY